MSESIINEREGAERTAGHAGKELNVDQKAKVDSIGAMRGELEELEARLQAM